MSIPPSASDPTAPTAPSDPEAPQPAPVRTRPPLLGAAEIAALPGVVRETCHTLNNHLFVALTRLELLAIPGVVEATGADDLRAIRQALAAAAAQVRALQDRIQPDPAEAPRPALGPAPGARPGRVLVVDAQPLVLQVLGRLVARAGLLPCLCPDAASALEAAAHDRRICLVLAEHRLDGPGGGLALATALYATRPEVPVVLMGGAASPEAGPPPPANLRPERLLKPIGLQAVEDLLLAVLGPIAAD